MWCITKEDWKKAKKYKVVCMNNYRETLKEYHSNWYIIAFYHYLFKTRKYPEVWLNKKRKEISQWTVINSKGD